MGGVPVKEGILSFPSHIYLVVDSEIILLRIFTSQTEEKK